MKSILYTNNTKNNISVFDAIESIVKNNHCKPTVIISHSDSTFLSNSFNELVKKYDINQNVVSIGNHHT